MAVCTLPLVLIALALSAPGDIYRCTNAAGQVSFQDHPCSGGKAAHLASAGEDSAASQLALQQWLDAHRKSAGAAMPPGAAVPSTPSGRLPLGAGLVSEAQLAACSERFLGCAQGDAGRMDACVNRLPRCSRHGADACCPQACISRYLALRQDGNPLAVSVRLALLDPYAPACAAPQPSG